jgi:hypothetical protein
MISGEIESHGELVVLEQLGKARGRGLAAPGTSREVGAACTVPKPMISSEIESYGEVVVLEQLGMARGGRSTASGTYKEMGSYCSPL